MNAARSFFSPALWVALLALAGTSAGLFYQHQQEVKTRAQVGSRLAELQAVVKQGQLTAQGAASAVQAMDSRVAALEREQADARAQQAALQTLHRDMLRDRQEWKLAEIEHMLFAANDQLQTTGNVRGAILALEIASQRLPKQNTPHLIRLRAAVNRDLDALRGVMQPDVPALSLQLIQLVQDVSSWPLVSGASRTAPPKGTPGPQGIAQRLLSDLGQVVQIRRLGPQEPALLTPQQGEYLRDNLRLRLLSARLALLARDQADFHQDVGAALSLGRRYFSAQDTRVEAGLQTLKRLARLNVAPPIPALTATMSALQANTPAPR